MNTDKQRVLIVAMLFILVGGCAAYAAIDLPIRADAQRDHMYWESVHRGALLFANNCRTCHGNQGEGFVAPALNTAEWRDQDPITLAENRQILRQTLYCGRAGTTMPAWLDRHGGALNERQIEWLINFITAPEEGEQYVDEVGQPTNRGWVEALEFAHNLNLELIPSITGDTIRSIADRHNIGVALLAEANNVPLAEADQIIPRGETIFIPPNSAHPEGFEYRIRGDFDTIDRLASTLYVGAAAVADLNNMNYAIDYSEPSFTLLDEQGEPLPGLLPGETLQLTEGAQYVVFAGDTLQSIAEQHNVSVGQIRELNEDLLEGIADDEVMDGSRRLDLPDNPTVVVAEGQTWDTLADRYDDIDGEQLALTNRMNHAEDPEPGTVLELPEETRYIVQDVDTLDSIAAAHQTDVQTLQQLNNIDDPAELTAELILDMPPIEAYVVQGATFEEVAADYGNVSAQSLAAASGFEADEAVRIGTQLRLPDESYGTAPADAINDGSACVRYAVPESIWQGIIGDDEDFPPDTAPEEFTDELVVHSFEIDWTFEADGELLPPNRGAVKIRPGTSVLFENPGTFLHTVTINGVTEDPQFAAGDTFEFTFDDPGEYRITCDFHPQQDGYIFVEEEGETLAGGDGEAADQ